MHILSQVLQLLFWLTNLFVSLKSVKNQRYFERPQTHFGFYNTDSDKVHHENLFGFPRQNVYRRLI